MRYRSEDDWSSTMTQPSTTPDAEPPGPRLSKRRRALLVLVVVAWPAAIVLNDWPNDLSPNDWTTMDWIGATITALVGLLLLFWLAKAILTRARRAPRT